MYAQIFDEAEYHHDPKATEPEQAVVVKEHVRKSRKTNAEKYKDLPTEVVEVPLLGSEQSCPDCGAPLVRVGKGIRPGRTGVHPGNTQTGEILPYDL